MRIALLTGHVDSSHARSILRALNERGVSGIDVIASAAQEPRRSLTARVRAHGWGVLTVGLGWLLRGVGGMLPQVRPAGDSQGTLASLTTAQGGRFVAVGDANGEACQQHLRRLGVDLLILAGAPIVRAPVLSIPRVGTLNAHLGALPRYRGMNTVEWAILEGAEPAISVHFVDAGVDTGDIVATQPVPVRPGDTLAAVRARANECQLDLLSRTVAAACGTELPRLTQKPQDGRQYYTLHPRLRAVAEARLASLHGARRPEGA